MSQAVQVGTILTEESPVTTQFIGLDNEPCSGNWSLVKALDGFALERKIHAAGWNFFFIATELSGTSFGRPGEKKTQDALKRILGKVEGQDFNCLEVTGIVAKHFLGVPYTTVSAHSRHIQQSCQLDAIDQRRACRRTSAGLSLA
jgi:hypothetical protein